MAKLNYWQKRFLQEKDRQLTNSAEYEVAMQARLKLVEQDLEKEVDYWIKRYADNQDTTVKEARKILKTIGTRDWHMTLKEFEAKAKQGGFDKELDAEYFRSQLSRLENINAQLVNLLYSTAQDEADRLEQGLASQFQDTYIHTLYNTQVQQAKLSSNFANVNEAQVKMIVNEPWQSSNFSKRVWHNYTEVLPNELTDALLRGTVLGHSEQQIFKMFRQRFKDVEDFQLHRLIITEMGHVAEQATAKGYEESGIEQYQYLATLESHTCEECAHLDGRIFSLKERKDGINYPLIHPYCRCTTMPYLNDLPDVKDRWARDPETGKGKYVGNMAFDKWKKQIDAEKAERYIREHPNLYKKVTPVVREVHNLPVKGEPLTVIGTSKKGEVVKYRYYGEDGYVEKDVDLTDHGNSKEHQIVPHLHIWHKRLDKKSGKLRLIRLKGCVLTKNELDDLRRWQNNG